MNKKYYIWGLFDNRDAIYLNNLKDEIQAKLSSPRFDLHITLAGPYLNLNSDFSEKLKNFCKNNHQIILDVKGLDYTNEIFKSFYLSINHTDQLEIFRSNISKIEAFDFKKNFLPHVSLAYGNHKINEKKRLISKINKLNKSIKVSKIGLVEINDDIKNWKILESFKLNYVCEL